MRKALLVGINKYTMMTALKSPLNDVMDLASYLVAEADFQLEKIQFLSDSQATRENIVNALQQLIVNSQAGDELLFYFTGHGLQVHDKSGDEHDNQDEALVTYAENKLQVLLDDDLHELFEILPENVVMYNIFDCCHSGVDENLASSSDRKGMDSGRYVIMSAALPDQSSWQMGSKNSIRKHGYEFWEDGRYHSAFTYYLLKVLRLFPEGLPCKRLVEKVNAYLAIHDYDQFCGIHGNEDLMNAAFFHGDY